jgi:hypothetical protein
MMIRSKRAGRGAVLQSLAFAGLLVTSAAFAATPALAAWDSIAVDDDTSTHAGDAGYGVGTADSKGGAEAEAMKTCKSEGNTNCKIAISYQTCGAYASSTHHAGIGTGRSKDAASAAAMNGCGNGGCKVVVSDCVGEQ